MSINIYFIAIIKYREPQIMDICTSLVTLPFQNRVEIQALIILSQESSVQFSKKNSYKALNINCVRD